MCFTPIHSSELWADVSVGCCHWSIPDTVDKVLAETANPVEKRQQDGEIKKKKS